MQVVLAFILKKIIKFDVLSNIPPLNDDCESLWLEILTNQGNFVLGVVYRQPVSNHTLFREMFLNTIRYLSVHKHLYYICGDFNINLGNLEVESNIKDYVNSLISLSCKLLVVNPPEFQIIQPQSFTICTLMTINMIYYLAYRYMKYQITYLFLLLQNK